MGKVGRRGPSKPRKERLARERAQLRAEEDKRLEARRAAQRKESIRFKRFKKTKVVDNLIEIQPCRKRKETDPTLTILPWLLAGLR